MKPVIDLSITPQTFREKELLYLYDVVYSPTQEIAELPGVLFRYALSHGGVLGLPHNASDYWPREAYALYIPRRLDKIIAPRIPVNMYLTAASASELGLRWVDDVDPYIQQEGLRAMSEWLFTNWDRLERGCQLGVAKSEQTDRVGLYGPPKKRIHTALPSTQRPPSR